MAEELLTKAKKVRRSLQKLDHWFDQVWVISLKRPPERLARFWKVIEKVCFSSQNRI